MAPSTVDESSGYEYKKNLIIGVGATLIALMVIAYGLRLYARRVSRADYWWDDYIMSAALVLSIASTVVEFLSLNHGLGKHAEGDGVTKHDLKYYVILLYIFEIISTTAIAIIKTSMLLFYYRLFPNQKFVYAIYAVQTLVIASWIMIIFGVMFQCTPIAYFWDKSIAGHCINVSPFYISITAVNLAADIMIVTMPLPIIWNLNTSAGRKIGLTLVFLLGGFTCIASILRIVTLTKVDTADITYSNFEGALWSFVECNLGFIAANLPSIWPLICKLFRTLNPSQRCSRDKKTTTTSESARKAWRRSAQQGSGFERMKKGSHDGGGGVIGVGKGEEEEGLGASWLELGMSTDAIQVRTDVHQTVEGEGQFDPGVIHGRTWIVHQSQMEGLPRAI